MTVRINGRVYRCGTCALWRRALGCTMPATPATVNCGRTRYSDLCEQWYPTHTVARVGRRWRVRRTVLNAEARRVRDAERTNDE